MAPGKAERNMSKQMRWSWTFPRRYRIRHVVSTLGLTEPALASLYS